MTNVAEKKLKIVMAQLNLQLGDVKYNTQQILQRATEARDKLNADVIVFPELTITGYPPEDLLLRPHLHHQVQQALNKITKSIKNIYVIIGHPTRTPEGKLFNSASVIYNGAILATYHKQLLPNYSVFDEKRYFKAGKENCVVEIHGIPMGIIICEDIWLPGPFSNSADAGAKLIISLNASPFHRNKPAHRIEILKRRLAERALPIVYVNCVGGQDELIFDGGSVVLNAAGEITHQAPLYQENLCAVALKVSNNKIEVEPGSKTPWLEETASIYHALVLGTRDYLEKNHMPGALIGLSGGIDSALTLAIAVDAIGKNNVHAVMMPSRYTSQMSQEDALSLATALGVKYSVISIEPIFTSFLNALKKDFQNTTVDLTEQNLQARARGTLLMALSNKFGKMVLTTGNKSELAVGYSTLYGDMVGGFAVLKDVLKTLVYQLVEYRNQINPVIPQRIIERAPTAELAENQVDQDTLPPYEILDKIISLYVEQDKSIEYIIEQGFDPNIVKEVFRRIDRNEYKRRQAPPGIRITQRAFGRDWRYPITCHYDSTKEIEEDRS